MMWSMRPSILGLLSAVAMSCVASTILFSIFQPSSVCAISRPLKRTVTFALWPSPRKRRTCFSLKSKSCFSVFGPIFTSLTWIVVCFFRASFRRRACVYLYFPKSMMRHTGGCASGATSTRSSSCCRAVSSACWIGRMPSCAPSAFTTRTSRTRIPSLMRISFAWLRCLAPPGWPPGTAWEWERPAARSRAAHGEALRARADLAREVGQHPVERDRAEVLARPMPETDGPVLALALADHEHVRDLPELRLADPVTELLVAVVELGPHVRGAQLRVHRARVLGVLLTDRQHARLDRREPGRERARVVLDEDAHEALEGAEDRAVDHDRALRLSVGINVLEREPVRLGEVDLDGRQLPAAPERVLDVDIDLRPVERALTRVQVVREPVRLERVVQGPLGRLPLRVGPHRLRRARGQLEERVEREGLVPVADELEQRRDLVLELVGTAVDVRVVLRELPHAEEARQGPRALVPVQPAHVGVAQREVPVRAQRVAVDERGLRAVHRLEAEDLLLGLHEEHVLAEVLPVPRLLPELLVDEDRCRDLLIAARVERLAHEALQLAHHRPAVRQPEGRSGRDVLEDVEVELPAELPMVALLRLLEPPEMLVELLLREPRGAVDALEHRVPLVAAPVGARGREQLEVLHVARGRHVRAAAEVDELALPVERHPGRVEPLEDLDLVGLAALAEEADRLLARELLALERIVRLRDLAHDGLDLLEVLGRERLRLREIVVEAVFDRGTDRHLHAGEQALHRLGHHVRGGVPEGRERRGIAVELAGQLEMAFFFRQWCARPGE